jgi:hypothetical protein
MEEAMIFRIMTEDKNLKGIKKILNRFFFDGYTLYHAEGMWYGKPEKSLVIEVSHELSTWVRACASEIRDLNKQDCVMIQYIQEFRTDYIREEKV